MKPTDIIAIVISIVSATIALSAYLLNTRNFRLAIKSYEDMHDFNRRQNAMRLIERWDEATLDARKAVLAVWAEAFLETKDIPWEAIEQERQRQIEALKASGKSDTGARLITDHMATIMNFLEVIAVSANNKVADEDILRQSYHVPLGRWYLILTDYRAHVTSLRKYNPWNPAEKLYKKWYEPHEIDKPQTGSA
jgi:hypothetical protein